MVALTSQVEELIHGGNQNGEDDAEEPHSEGIGGHCRVVCVGYGSPDFGIWRIIFPIVTDVVFEWSAASVSGVPEYLLVLVAFVILALWILGFWGLRLFVDTIPAHVRGILLDVIHALAVRVIGVVEMVMDIIVVVVLVVGWRFAFGRTGSKGISVRTRFRMYRRGGSG